VFYTLTDALKATGLEKVTILTAIEAGKITAVKDLFGEWQIEHAALHRVFPPVSEHGSGRDAGQRCTAPDAATLETDIEALVREAKWGSGRESASESLPIHRMGFNVPAELAWDHPIGTSSWDRGQWFRGILTTGALMAMLGLGWIGGSSSHHFFAPKQTAASSAPTLGSANETICIPSPEMGRVTASVPNTRKGVPTAPSPGRGHATAHDAASTYPASPVAQRNTASPDAKILSRPRTTPTPDTRPTTIPGWTIRDVVGGAVVLEGPDGIVRATRGDTVPGVGRVDSIVRWGSRWIVATSKGLITTP